MKQETKHISNFYWSFRKFLFAELPDQRWYWNPIAKPQPTDVDEWVIFILETYRAELFTRPFSRILCVARKDADSSKLIDLATTITTALEPTDYKTNKKRLVLYDRTTGDAIGTIYIDDISISNPMEYDTGINSVAIDIYSRLKTARSLKL
jgi:hypothetical protein